MTYEEFLVDPDADEDCEWVDGLAVPGESVSLTQSRTSGFRLLFFGAWGEGHGGVTLMRPFNMKTGPELPGRTPDVIYIQPEHRNRIRENFLDGPADVVVEVADRETFALDRGQKYLEYETGGVPEYWLIDPERRVAEFYILGPDGRYELQRLPDGVFQSTQLPQLRIRVEWLWERPPFLRVIQELGLS